MDKIFNIPLESILKISEFNDYIADNLEEVMNSLNIKEWILETKNENNTEFTIFDDDARKKILIFSDIGRFQEDNLHHIMALTYANKVNRVIWIFEHPTDKTIAALMHINHLAKKKFITLMTAQAFKIGNSKPAIEFREH